MSVIDHALQGWHVWLLERTDGWFRDPPARVGSCTDDLLCPNEQHTKRCIAYTTNIDTYARRFGK